ncbi:MAG: hypothetical protein ACE5G9_03025 [Nitrospinales bacterium]
MTTEQKTAAIRLIPANARRAGLADGAAVLLLTALCLEFFAPVLFQDKTFFYRDVPMAAYPMKLFLSRAYHEGFLPFWNPALFCGMPFMATLHPGAFYPPSAIFFLDDFVAAFNWYFVLHHLFLSVSVFALCRCWRLSVGAALCSALTAFAGGYFLSLMNMYNHYQSMVWLPAIFLFFQRYLQTAGTGNFLAAVACLTCQTLGGSPENSVMTVCLLGAHSILVVPAAETRVAGTLRRAAALGALVLPSLGLAALQLLPTYAIIKDSVRNTALLFSDHAKWSLEPSTLATLLLPKNFAGFMERTHPMAVSFLQSVYMGIFPLVFLGLGWLLWKDKAVRFWSAVFFVGIFLALGKYNPMYEPLYHWVPFLGIFRYPEKFYFLSAFSLVFLTGHGIDAAMRRVAEGTLDLRKVWGVLLGLGVLTGLADLANRHAGASGLALTLGFLLLFGFAWSMLHFKKLRPAVMKTLLTALILSDLLWRHYMLTPMIDKNFFLQEPGLLKKVQAPAGELYRIYSGPITGKIDFGQFVRAPNLLLSHIFAKEELRPNLGTIYGLNYVNGMPGVELHFISLRYEIFKHSPPEKRRRILERSNVKYQVLSIDLSDRPEDVPESLPTGVVELKNALPRAFLVPKARVESYPHLVNLFFDESFDPRKEVLLDAPPPLQIGEEAGFEGTVTAIDYRPNRVRIRSRQNAGGFLVLLDSWFPGWRVKVDGEPGTLLRADYFYRAVQLPAGEHNVEFYYEPEGFAAGVRISLGTLLILLAGAAWRRVRLRY